MVRKNKNHQRWWLVFLFLLITVIYLNRAYAYFFDYLESHQILASNLAEKTEFRSNSVPNGPFTYAALGDSLTYGTGVNNINETFPYLVAQNISKNRSIDLYNLGIPGATTDEVIKFELIKLPNLQPQIITLLIGINDAIDLQTDEAFRKNYRIILDRITTDQKAKVIVINIPSLPNSKNMLPPYKYLMDLRIGRFNSIIDNLVAEKKQSFKNIIFINLYDETKQKFLDDPALYSEDYFHPGKSGYKLWSEIINDNLNF